MSKDMASHMVWRHGLVTLSRRELIHRGLVLTAIGLGLEGSSISSSTAPYALFVELGETKIPAGVDKIATRGHSRIGIGAAHYIYDPSITPAKAKAHPSSIFRAADGRYFRIDEPSPELAMFGAIPDWSGRIEANGKVTTRIGTNNALPIQRALNYLHDYDISSLRVDGLYGFAAPGAIIIPPRVSLAGSGPESAMLIITEARLGPAVLWGTYGPSARPEISPSAESRYLIADALAGTSSIELLQSKDSVRFAPGAIVFIEGGTPARSGQFGTPNLIRRVASVDSGAGRLKLDEPLDLAYFTTAQRTAAVRLLNAGTVPAVDTYTIDPTGRKWPLFVAEGTSVRDLTIAQSAEMGWPSIFTSAVDFEVANVRMRNCFYWAFQPAARGRVTNTHWTFTNRALEAAYGAHDLSFVDCSATRVDGAGPSDDAPLVWTNDGEGGKRLHFERFTLLDSGRRHPKHGETGTNIAFGLLDSSLLDSTADAPGGGIGYFIGSLSDVRNTRFIANRTSRTGRASWPSVMLRDGLFEGNTILCPTGTGAATVAALGSVRVLNNVIGADGERSAADRIVEGPKSAGRVVQGNRTFVSSRG